MSRVGKNPVAIPDGVEVTVDGVTVKAKGKLGELSFVATEDVKIAVEDKSVVVTPVNDSKKARSMWGTARARISNLVEGVSNGFAKELEINGVGYRAQVQGQTLNLSLGFSHDVLFPIPEGIEIKCEKPTSVRVSGRDKQLVGQVAANIRAYRPPEPYKGKGVKYADEVILRKEGKKK
ncbi:50S ribosomal protein L6 [Kiloniella sp. b19]|uniref:50S ribosomal protein L6 n=1 Tax=Kiloniella sp. GXU_MW_B19 TaxID=3141326 RepID=UPI0031E48781